MPADPPGGHLVSLTVMVRPRLLAVSLAVALVVGVVGGWALHRFGGGVEEVVLTDPGEHPLPFDAPESAAGPRFPDVTLFDADGVETRSGDLLGRPLVVNVWFSTCPPCVRELADFAAVHADVGDRVRFVGVNPLDGPDRMVEFAAERGVAYELLRDTDSRFLDAIGVTSFPRTYFVDPAGVVVGEHGELHEDELRRYIAEHFGETT